MEGEERDYVKLSLSRPEPKSPQLRLSIEDSAFASHVRRVRASRRQKLQRIYEAMASGLPRATKEDFINESMRSEKIASLCRRHAHVKRRQLEECDDVILETSERLMLERQRLTDNINIQELTRDVLRRKHLDQKVKLEVLHYAVYSLKLLLLEEIQKGSKWMIPLFFNATLMIRAQWSDKDPIFKFQMFKHAIQFISDALKENVLEPLVKKLLEDCIDCIDKLVEGNVFWHIDDSESQVEVSPATGRRKTEKIPFYLEDLEKVGLADEFREFLENTKSFLVKEYVRESTLEDVMRQRGHFGRPRRPDNTIRLPVR